MTRLTKAAAAGFGAMLLLAPVSRAETADPAPEDRVLARVDGEPIRLSDVATVAAESVPPELRRMPADELLRALPPEAMRQLTDRAITERALVIAARRQGLENDPLLKARLRRAEEQELVQALLGHELAGEVTDQVLRARYEEEIKKRQPEEEVHARHILLPTEAAAKEVLAQLKAGADFAELARKLSTDPGARNGGDLGFFKQGDMVPEFAEVAFALKPGEVSPAPVHTQFGWHVIRVEERRTAPPPGFAQMEEELRRQLLQERVRTVVDRIRAAAVVERLDQPPPNPTRSLLENAAPPPAAPPAR